MTFYTKYAVAVVSLGIASYGTDASGAVTQVHTTPVEVHAITAPTDVLNVHSGSQVSAQVHTTTAPAGVLNVHGGSQVPAQVHTTTAPAGVLNVHEAKK